MGRVIPKFVNYSGFFNSLHLFLAPDESRGPAGEQCSLAILLLLSDYLTKPLGDLFP